MDIAQSLEVRWFLAPSHPEVEAASAWFEGVAVEPARVDHYLVTGRPDLGVKTRSVAGRPTRLETKHRVSARGDVSLAPSVVGRIERWSKLSARVHEEEAEAREPDCWVALVKRRQKRTFRLEPGTVAEVAAAERPASGCGIEFTQLWEGPQATGGPVAWTLGFESFGSEGLHEAALERAYTAARDAGLALQLGAECSMGYPAWLLRSPRPSGG